MEKKYFSDENLRKDLITQINKLIKSDDQIHGMKLKKTTIL